MTHWALQGRRHPKTLCFNDPHNDDPSVLGIALTSEVAMHDQSRTVFTRSYLRAKRWNTTLLIKDRIVVINDVQDVEDYFTVHCLART